MEPDAVSQRVQSVISQSGRTNEQFALSVGLDAPKLSKSLNGKRRFTSLELAQIADAGGVTVDWLLSGEVESMAARVSGGSGNIEVAAIEAQRVAEARENLLFLRAVDIRSDWPAMPATTKSLWREQGAELADHVLNLIGQPNVLSGSNFGEVLESVLGVDVAVVDTGGACDGLALQTESARIAVVSTSKNPTRQRFTLAHELCHLLCGDDQGLHVDRNITDDASKRGESEVRANAFAAALLMPEVLLRDRLSLTSVVSDRQFADLVMELMVSPSALSWRLLNLGLVDSAERRRLGQFRTIDCAASADQTAQYAEWLDVSTSLRRPSRLMREVLVAYLNGKSTLQPFANLIEMDVDDIRAVVEQTVQAEADEFVP